MNQQVKDSISFNAVWLYVLIIISCISGYFISKAIQGRIIIEKEITYTSTNAIEVYMVWAMMGEELPPEKNWPPGSFMQDNMVWTKTTKTNEHFSTSLKLHAGSVFYYWMVQLKDKNGNPINYWDTGENDKEYFIGNVPQSGFMVPGYFIFLAGAIPLLVLLFKNRKKQINHQYIEKFRTKEYIPQLDGIRAIAVLLVILHHWVPQKSILNFLPNGQIGVNVFFVLSGFLITGILLKSKNQVEIYGVKKSAVFKNFYIRRTLRIFPIYYLVLIIFWMIDDPAIKKDGIYYFTYTTNYLFYSGQFFPVRLAHLWSLAVEEQFYLLWPWLIILVNKKYLSYMIALFILIGISINYILTGKDWWVEILTPACFDALAIGAMLSYITLFRQDVIAIIGQRFKWIIGVIVILFGLDAFDYNFIPSRTIHSLMAAAIIYYCLFKNNIGIVNYVLNQKWLIRIGKVSYGVYLYHLFVPELWRWILDKFASWNIDLFYNKLMPLQFEPLWIFIQEFSFLMIICALSWKFIEKPINNLKRNFENKISSPALKNA